mmetsp:Transcript_28217/g.47962  ORF Transcript_28217/g.47962 Transcript_28217/m.47962 type:complete len:243 (+) Transcript_28217:984-1712(+)
MASYERLHSSTPVTERTTHYTSLVNSYYDLATLFYEWGWGASFHFSNRHPHESFDEATRRHEFYLASKLNLSGALAGLRMATSGGKQMKKSSSSSKVEEEEEAMKEASTPSMANVKNPRQCGIGGPHAKHCIYWDSLISSQAMSCGLLKYRSASDFLMLSINLRTKASQQWHRRFVTIIELNVKNQVFVESNRVQPSLPVHFLPLFQHPALDNSQSPLHCHNKPSAQHEHVDKTLLSDETYG